MIKVREYVLRKNGFGHMVAIPPEYVDDLKVKVGDYLFALPEGGDLQISQERRGNAYMLRWNNTGYILSVPSEWVKENGLSQSDRLEVYRTDDNKLVYRRKE